MFYQFCINCVNSFKKMAKRLIDVFRDDFLSEIKTSKNYPEAFEKANAKFEERHGFTAFNSYETFRRKKRGK